MYSVFRLRCLHVRSSNAMYVVISISNYTLAWFTPWTSINCFKSYTILIPRVVNSSTRSGNEIKHTETGRDCMSLKPYYIELFKQLNQLKISLNPYQFKSSSYLVHIQLI